MKKPGTVQTVLSVASCKAARAVLRRTGRGGTAVPGIIAMKVARRILSAVSDGMQIIVVTGTNGKTTTCNMIEHAVSFSGKDCLRDKSGANLLHGIASDLICSADWRGRPQHPYAVLECDEAALKQVVQFITPAAIVVTNLFSDQMDRYGSVQNTLKEIRTGVERSPHSTLVLNAEDPLSASLSLHVPNKIVWYGLEETVGTRGNVDLTDAGTCPECGSPYAYDYHIYAQLGGFRCTKCGYRRQSPDVAVTSIDRMTAEGSTVRMRTRTQGTVLCVSPAAAAPGAGSGSAEEIREAHIALPAVYNVYNAAAAVAAATAIEIPAETAILSLSSVRSAFGRMETFDLNGLRVQMILVKNPAGCNQAFSYVTGMEEDYTAVLCLNDRTGDGHDISWIDSTDYEKLCADPHLKKLYAGGDRAEDLCERLKKAGAGDRLERFSDYPSLVEKLSGEGRPIFLLPNYTAMMELRDALSARTGSKDFWE